MTDDITYENITNPYDPLLQRSTSDISVATNNSNGNVQEATVKSDGAMADVWISSFIRSENWQPKTVGFYIDGQTGHAEFADIFVKGGIIGSSLNIPDVLTANSFHVDSLGNTWWGTNQATGYVTAPAYILNTGAASFTSVTIGGSSTIGGRLATTIGSSINSSGDFINDLINSNLDTSAKTILGSFKFQSSGAIAMNTDASNGLWLSPTGLLGKKAGVTTFAIDTLGNATFAGTLSGASGTFGTVTSGTLIGMITHCIGNSLVSPALDFYSSISDYNASNTTGSVYAWKIGSARALVITGKDQINLNTSSGGVVINGNVLSGVSDFSTSGYVSIGKFLNLATLSGATASGYTAQNGSMYYRTDDNVMRIFAGGVWTTVGSGSTGANYALSNLVSVAINTSLLPYASNNISLGSSALSWYSLYVNNVLINTSGRMRLPVGTNLYS